MPSISATRLSISGLRMLVLLQPEGHVLLHRHVREQRVALEHHVHRPLVGRQRRQVLAVHPDLAAGGLLEAREHAQQRGLAAARGAEQGEDLALPDVQADLVDGDEAVELLAHAVEADVALARPRLPASTAAAAWLTGRS
jgi:hypothetical protein